MEKDHFGTIGFVALDVKGQPIFFGTLAARKSGEHRDREEEREEKVFHGRLSDCWTKWIGGFLLFDGCLWAVPGENRRLSGQRVEFFADGVEELLVIPAGKVGPPDAPVEKGVARKKEGFRGQVEANGVRGMAGNVGDFKGEIADFQGRGLGKQLVDLVGRQQPATAPRQSLGFTQVQVRDTEQAARGIPQRTRGQGTQVFSGQAKGMRVHAVFFTRRRAAIKASRG